MEVLLNLSARIEELERKIALLTRDTPNSSKPPSSDGPGTKLRPRRPEKSKKSTPGGQSGHRGTNRDLIVVENVDIIVEAFPQRCEHCGAELSTNVSGATGKY